MILSIVLLLYLTGGILLLLTGLRLHNRPDPSYKYLGAFLVIAAPFWPLYAIKIYRSRRTVMRAIRKDNHAAHREQPQG